MYIEVIGYNFLKLDFTFANSPYPDEMQYYAAFHLGLHCVPKFQGFPVFKEITIFRPMEFSIKLHTIESGWSIVYIEVPQVKIFQIIAFLSLEIGYCL